MNGSEGNQSHESASDVRRGRSFLVVGIVGLLSVGWFLKIAHPIDDAYIFFRYARNLVEGFGLVYNVGERVEGYTSFLWVLLLAAFAKLGLNLIPVSVGLGLGFSALTVWQVWRFGWRFFDVDSKPTWVGLAALLLGTNGCFLCWTYVGMDTPLYTLLLTSALFVFIGEEARGWSQSRPYWSAVVLGVAALARPEALILLPLNLLVLAFNRAKAGQGWFWPVCHYALLFALVVGPHFLWRYSYYGSWLPNTYYAKMHGGDAAFLWRGVQYSLSFVIIYAWWLLAAAGAFVGARGAPFWVKHFLAVSLLCALAATLEGGDCFTMFRFFVPVMPILALATAYGAARWRMVIPVADSASSAGEVKIPTTSGLCAAAVFLVWATPNAQLAWTGDNLWRFLREQYWAKDFVRAGQWLRTVARKGDSVAVFAAGAVPYYSGLPTIDMLGLNDRRLARVKMRRNPFLPGHEKYDSSYVLRRRPIYILLTKMTFHTALSEADYIAICSYFPPAWEILKNPDLKAHYEFRTEKFGDRYCAFYRLRKAFGGPG